MEAKHGRVGGFFLDEGAGATRLEYALGKLQQVLWGRKPWAPGKFGMLAAALKQLCALSLAVLRDAIAEEVAKVSAAMILRELESLDNVLIVGIPCGAFGTRGRTPHRHDLP